MSKEMKNWTITIEGVSAEDMKKFAEKAGAYGISAGGLIGSFINDLINGAASNGSDERMYAQQWSERCWFGTFPEYSFLRYLIENDSPDTVLDAWEGIEQSKQFIHESEVALADPGYDWQNIKTSKGTQIYSSRDEWEVQEREDIEAEQEYIAGCKEILSDCWDDYVRYDGNGNCQKGTFDEEIRKVVKWADDNYKFHEVL